MIIPIKSWWIQKLKKNQATWHQNWLSINNVQKKNSLRRNIGVDGDKTGSAPNKNFINIKIWSSLLFGRYSLSLNSREPENLKFVMGKMMFFSLCNSIHSKCCVKVRLMTVKPFVLFSYVYNVLLFSPFALLCYNI